MLKNFLFITEITETLGLSNLGRSDGPVKVFHARIEFKTEKEVC